MKYCIANWKMNMNHVQANEYLKILADFHNQKSVEDVLMIICPPYTLLDFIHNHRNFNSKLGIQNFHPEKKGAYAMVIDNEEDIVFSYPHAAPLSEPGDVALAHWLVLHRSGFNSSDRCRWAMQMRHFSFDNETGITNSWVGSFAAGVNIESIHPEYVIKE